LYWRTECKLWQIDLFFSGTNRNIMSAITSLGLGF
jgi:hypothetical protein